VTVGGAPAEKAARLVAPDEPIVLLGPPARFVGRGGDKLEAAIVGFGLDVSGRRAVDLGASTGGFTDCLLQHGAATVVAVDVGYGQLHERLRADPRVRVHERTNARDLTPGDLGPLADVLVADLSFISLRTVLPAALALTAPGADAVLLVKPQFEAGRQEAARGKGVITDPAIWRRVLEEVSAALIDLGAAIMGAMASPLTGADGNVEFLLHVRTAPAQSPVATPVLLEAALAQAERVS
jgi:23S rRNA (cytidine1920-2'-O)/16S rRNA (cytidine1409-2'-O)-methyltransferase